MACSFKLSLPTDIPWERICVSEDMIDPVVCDKHLPAKWQTSLAVFKYRPDDEFQMFPEYNITYSRLNIIAGIAKTLGVFFFTFDSVMTYNWPATTGWFSPATWGDMTSNGYNWEIPEFSNIFYIYVILFLAFPVFYYWMKQRRLA